MVFRFHYYCYCYYLLVISFLVRNYCVTCDAFFIPNRMGGHPTINGWYIGWSEQGQERLGGGVCCRLCATTLSQKIIKGTNIIGTQLQQSVKNEEERAKGSTQPSTMDEAIRDESSPSSFVTIMDDEIETKNVVLTNNNLHNNNNNTSSMFPIMRVVGTTIKEQAQQYPFLTSILIASSKSTIADLVTQIVIVQTSINDIDWSRVFLFCIFGAIYSGAFQYLYQVQLFRRIPIFGGSDLLDEFTTQTWSNKFRNRPGLLSLLGQTCLDLLILIYIYLPTFYIFKMVVIGGGGGVVGGDANSHNILMTATTTTTSTSDPSSFSIEDNNTPMMIMMMISSSVSTGLETFHTNFEKDTSDVICVWLPANLIGFSVPFYLRLPVRHLVSFVWTVYLSFARGGHS